MLPRLIATDLDGTLVPFDQAAPDPATAELLRRVDRRGIPLVFVTARPLRWMAGFWPHVGRHGMAIVSNGAIVYDVHSRSVRSVEGVGPEPGLELVRQITAAVPGATFALECVDGVRHDPEFDEPHPVPAGTLRGPLHEIWDAPAVKILVRHRTRTDDDFRAEVIAAVGDAANATWTVPGLVEISAAGVTKASALAAICAEQGIDPADVVAFGDMPNDIPMLAWAGTAYAMADAHPDVRAAADHLAPRCEDRGVAQVLEQLLDEGRHT